MTATLTSAPATAAQEATLQALAANTPSARPPRYRLVAEENFQRPRLLDWPLETYGEPTPRTVAQLRRDLNQSYGAGGVNLAYSQAAGRLINYRALRVYSRRGQLAAQDVAPLFEVL